MEIINKYKKHCNVKVVISTMATRQYGTLVCEGFKLFKGYFENINGAPKPFIDEFVGLEDWREKCWDRRYPRHYGIKSLPFVGLLFGINPSDIIAIDDKPQIWTNMRQVIYAVPYEGGIYLKQENAKEDNNIEGNHNDTSKQNPQKDETNNSLKINDVLYKIAKYLESYLCHTLGVLSKQRRLSEQYNKKKHIKLQLQLSNPVVTTHVIKHNHNENNIKIYEKNNEKNLNILTTINHKHVSIHDIENNKITLVTV